MHIILFKRVKLINVSNCPTLSEWNSPYKLDLSGFMLKIKLIWWWPWPLGKNIDPTIRRFAPHLHGTCIGHYRHLCFLMKLASMNGFLRLAWQSRHLELPKVRTLNPYNKVYDGDSEATKYERSIQSSTTTTPTHTQITQGVSLHETGQGTAQDGIIWRNSEVFSPKTWSLRWLSSLTVIPVFGIENLSSEYMMV